VLDFSDVLLRALALLRQMEEFSRSRYRLESRYHHVLVDEFQDTSRAQWELISLLVQAWGEGAGLATSGPLLPSIFIVGDRKQSIYGFRDADGSLLAEAGRHLELLRPEGDVRRSISRSFRSVPGLLAFVNDLCHDIDKAPGRRDGFRYEEEDRFPIELPTPKEPTPNALTSILGIVARETPEDCAEDVAAEIARLIADETPVRDRDTGVRRPVRPGDIAVLFRTRDSHREFESALERRGIAAFVYKGPRLFRRGRNQGRAGAALVSRRSAVESASGRGHAVAIHPHVRRGLRLLAPKWRMHCMRWSRRRPLRASIRWMWKR
jgi:ATP-dependent helicase/nuclease subunit A